MKKIKTPNYRSDGLFNYACVSPDGVLYEDNIIQVGVQSHFFKHQGRLVLSYGNFTGGPITNITTQLLSTSAATSNPLHLAQQRPPVSIDSKKQAQQLIDVTCLSEFVDPPALKLDYSVGGKPFSQIIKLPVVVLRFLQPHRITEQEFLKMWPEPPNAQNEKQQVVDTGAPGNLSYAMQMFSEGFHMCVIPGTSWNQNNVVGCALFHCAAGCLPCLVRMEISPTTTLYRITVRSPSQALSVALLSLLAIIFGKPTTI